MRTSEITRVQRASHPSAGIPPVFSDNGTGRKECAGCGSRPGGKERPDKITWEICVGQWGLSAEKRKRSTSANKAFKMWCVCMLLIL